MKLQEQLRKANLSTWISQADTEKLEVIAEEFAVGFAYWLTDSRNENVTGEISVEELLEIYKKENQL